MLFCFSLWYFDINVYQSLKVFLFCDYCNICSACFEVCAWVWVSCFDELLGQMCWYSLWCIAKHGGGYTQKGVAYVYMVVYPAYLWSLRWVYAVKKTRRLVYGVYPPNTPLGIVSVRWDLSEWQHWAVTCGLVYIRKYSTSFLLRSTVHRHFATWLCDML